MTFLSFYQHMNTPLILEIQPILLSWDHNDHIHSWLRPPKYFPMHFLFQWICINVHKIRLSGHFESILVHISGIRFFPSMGFVQEYSKQYKLSLYTKFRKKLITKFSNKFKKSYVWPILGAIFFSFKNSSCQAQHHMGL